MWRLDKRHSSLKRWHAALQAWEQICLLSWPEFSQLVETAGGRERGRCPLRKQQEAESRSWLSSPWCGNIDHEENDKDIYYLTRRLQRRITTWKQPHFHFPPQLGFFLSFRSECTQCKLCSSMKKNKSSSDLGSCDAGGCSESGQKSLELASTRSNNPGLSSAANTAATDAEAAGVRTTESLLPHLWEILTHQHFCLSCKQAEPYFKPEEKSDLHIWLSHRCGSKTAQWRLSAPTGLGQFNSNQLMIFEASTLNEIKQIMTLFWCHNLKLFLEISHSQKKYTIQKWLWLFLVC